jgi:hypothetical protein
MAARASFKATPGRTLRPRTIGPIVPIHRDPAVPRDPGDLGQIDEENPCRARRAAPLADRGDANDANIATLRKRQNVPRAHGSSRLQDALSVEAHLSRPDERAGDAARAEKPGDP